MTSINTNNNLNEIRQYAETIFAKLDEKDGKDESISRSIWNQFIGAKVEEEQIGNGQKSEIKFKIAKDAAIKSIISYLKKIGLDKKEQIDNIVNNIQPNQQQSISETQNKIFKAADKSKTIVSDMEKKYPEIVKDAEDYIEAKKVLSSVRDALGISAFLDPETNKVNLDLDKPEDCEKVRQYYRNVINDYRSRGYNDIADRYLRALESFENALSTISTIKQKYANAQDPSFDDYLNAKMRNLMLLSVFGLTCHLDSLE